MSESNAINNTANPAPLGLLGFGMTTVLLNLHNAGFFPLDTMILAMGIFYGGITPNLDPAAYIPEIRKVRDAGRVLDGLVGGWLPADSHPVRTTAMRLSRNLSFIVFSGKCKCPGVAVSLRGVRVIEKTKNASGFASGACAYPLALSSAR